FCLQSEYFIGLLCQRVVYNCSFVRKIYNATLLGEKNSSVNLMGYRSKVIKLLGIYVVVALFHDRK
ncbi:MAG TPA: hypothetical protein VJR67_00650, partial [Candidatus Nitrosopolaris sp.]|nr:hypothetical protein [Candidatus Nitrosopolaris sp.]